jgi:hypothetical protein
MVRSKSPSSNDMSDRVLSWTFALTAVVLLLFVVYEQLLGPAPNPAFGLVAVRGGIALFEPPEAMGQSARPAPTADGGSLIAG